MDKELLRMCKRQELEICMSLKGRKKIESVR